MEIGTFVTTIANSITSLVSWYVALYNVLIMQAYCAWTKINVFKCWKIDPFLEESN